MVERISAAPASEVGAIEQRDESRLGVSAGLSRHGTCDGAGQNAAKENPGELLECLHGTGLIKSAAAGNEFLQHLGAARENKYTGDRNDAAADHELIRPPARHQVWNARMG